MKLKLLFPNGRSVHGPWFHLLSPHKSVHVDSPPTAPALTTSYVRSSPSTPLVLHTVGEVLQRAVERFPDREALVFIEQGVRKTFAQFQQDVSLFIDMFKVGTLDGMLKIWMIYEGTNNL